MHICGTCSAEFETEEQYLDHTCTTGYTPRDIEHQDILTDGAFSRISEAAIERGAEKQSEETKVARLKVRVVKETAKIRKEKK